MQPRHSGLVGETGLCSRGLSLLSLNSQVQDAPDLAALHFVLLLLTSSLHFTFLSSFLRCFATSAAQRARAGSRAYATQVDPALCHIISFDRPITDSIVIRVLAFS